MMDAEQQARFNVRAQAAAVRGRELMNAPRKSPTPIVTKVSKQRGMTYGGQDTGMFAQFSKTEDGKNKIHLTGRYGNYADVDITFAEGDVAIYDSFNFDYIGTIERITEKTVKIRHQHGNSVTQLDLATFANRNYKFDLEKSNAARAAWYD